MVGQHHRFNRHELGRILEDSEGEGGLACCSPWDCKELDMTQQLNNNTEYLSCIFKLHHSGFPDGSDGKESACIAGDLGLIPWSGSSPEEGNGNPLQYSCLEKFLNKGAWRATVHGVTESDMTEQLTFSLRVMQQWTIQYYGPQIIVSASAIRGKKEQQQPWKSTSLCLIHFALKTVCLSDPPSFFCLPYQFCAFPHMSSPIMEIQKYSHHRIEISSKLVL